MNPNIMLMSTNALFPLVKDSEGKLLVRHTKCLRIAWLQENRMDNLFNRRMCWEIAQTEDDGHLLLVSRPSGIRLEPTAELGKHLLSYEEPLELRPEDYPQQWQKAQDAGVEVWATIEGQTLTLHGNRANSLPLDDRIKITHKRRMPNVPDKTLGAHMWDELLAVIDRLYRL